MEAGGEYYNIIIMDLNMPVMDGIEAIKEINERDSRGEIDRSQMKVIAASAVGEEIFRDMQESSLFDGFSNLFF